MIDFPDRRETPTAKTRYWSKTAITATYTSYCDRCRCHCCVPLLEHPHHILDRYAPRLQRPRRFEPTAPGVADGSGAYMYCPQQQPRRTVLQQHGIALCRPAQNSQGTPLHEFTLPQQLPTRTPTPTSPTYTADKDGGQRGYWVGSAAVTTVSEFLLSAAYRRFHKR